MYIVLKDGKPITALDLNPTMTEYAEDEIHREALIMTSKAIEFVTEDINVAHSWKKQCAKNIFPQSEIEIRKVEL